MRFKVTRDILLKIWIHSNNLDLWRSWKKVNNAVEDIQYKQLPSFQHKLKFRFKSHFLFILKFRISKSFKQIILDFNLIQIKMIFFNELIVLIFLRILLKLFIYSFLNTSQILLVWRDYTEKYMINIIR